jgi:hypothetical protein
MSEEAEAFLVLPLQEAAAHFACRNARSAEAEMGGSRMEKLMRAFIYIPRVGNRVSSVFQQAVKAESLLNKVLAFKSVARERERGKVPCCLYIRLEIDRYKLKSLR